jgi:ATP-dependent Clp protease ATP-binding subunit ClpA
VLLTSITVAASLTFLVAYNRYWKPCPTECDGLKNLNVEVLNQKDPIYPRLSILKKIEEAFEAKKGVILVGEPGCGKTLSVMSLVDQALKGKILNCISDPQFFSSNASRFKTVGYEMQSFSMLDERFKMHPEQVVFFFDEFHALFQSEGIQFKQVGDEIKTFYETYRNIIGATTTNEFDRYVKNQTAITGRRFQVIYLEQLKDEEIVNALNLRLGGMNSFTAYDPNVFDYIVKKAKENANQTSVIDSAQALLSKALQKIHSVKHVDAEEKVAVLESELEILQQKGIHAIQGSCQGIIDQIKDKETQLKEAQSQLDKLNQRTEKMLKMEKYLLSLKRQAYQISDPNMKLVKESAQEREWLKLHARIQLVSNFIRKERKQLDFPHILDQQLVDSLV